MTNFLISGLLLIYCFQRFQDPKKIQKFFLCILFFINLLSKAKRKQNFSIYLHHKYYKKEAIVII
jgi:uncharacterized membrane protein